MYGLSNPAVVLAARKLHLRLLSVCVSLQSFSDAAAIKKTSSTFFTQSLSKVLLATLSELKTQSGMMSSQMVASPPSSSRGSQQAAAATVGTFRATQESKLFVFDAAKFLLNKVGAAIDGQERKIDAAIMVDRHLLSVVFEVRFFLFLLVVFFGLHLPRLLPPSSPFNICLFLSTFLSRSRWNFLQMKTLATVACSEIPHWTETHAGSTSSWQLSLCAMASKGNLPSATVLCIHETDVRSQFDIPTFHQLNYFVRIVKVKKQFKQRFLLSSRDRNASACTDEDVFFWGGGGG